MNERIRFDDDYFWLHFRWCSGLLNDGETDCRNLGHIQLRDVDEYGYQLCGVHGKKLERTGRLTVMVNGYKSEVETSGLWVRKHGWESTDVCWPSGWFPLKGNPGEADVLRACPEKDVR